MMDRTVLTGPERRLLLKELPRRPFYVQEPPEPAELRAARRIVKKYEQQTWQVRERLRARFDRAASKARILILTSQDRAEIRRAIEAVNRIVQAAGPG